MFLEYPTKDTHAKLWLLRVYCIFLRLPPFAMLIVQSWSEFTHGGKKYLPAQEITDSFLWYWLKQNVTDQQQCKNGICCFFVLLHAVTFLLLVLFFNNVFMKLVLADLGQDGGLILLEDIKASTEWFYRILAVFRIDTAKRFFCSVSSSGMRNKTWN